VPATIFFGSQINGAGWRIDLMKELAGIDVQAMFKSSPEAQPRPTPGTVDAFIRPPGLPPRAAIRSE